MLLPWHPAAVGSEQVQRLAGPAALAAPGWPSSPPSLSGWGDLVMRILCSLLCPSPPALPRRWWQSSDRRHGSRPFLHVSGACGAWCRLLSSRRSGDAFARRLVCSGGRSWRRDNSGVSPARGARTGHRSGAVFVPVRAPRDTALDGSLRSEPYWRRASPQDADRVVAAAARLPDAGRRRGPGAAAPGRGLIERCGRSSLRLANPRRPLAPLTSRRRRACGRTRGAEPTDRT
jgi:hypothetical protein